MGASHHDDLRGQGVEVVEWNLCGEDRPSSGQFGAMIFSEVIEHLPILRHVVLERLRDALRPDGAVRALAGGPPRNPPRSGKIDPSPSPMPSLE